MTAHLSLVPNGTIRSKADSAEGAYERSLRKGVERTRRSLLTLLATGAVGGLDMGTGVLGMLLAEHYSGSKLLAGLAFSIGFIALHLAKSELFTEGFLIPVVAVISRASRLRDLLRFWLGTAIGNLAGGWVVTALIISGMPSLRPKALELGTFYASLGTTWRAFALALLGGMVITLMTWMHSNAKSEAGGMVPSVASGFLLGAGSLNHAIVASLLMFAALHTGHAPFGYGTWAICAGWATLGNIAGGVGLVTILRCAQVRGTRGTLRP